MACKFFPVAIFSLIDKLCSRKRSIESEAWRSSIANSAQHPPRPSRNSTENLPLKNITGDLIDKCRLEYRSYVNCILLGNWQLKNSIDDWLVQQPQKLTVGASGCQPCTNFYSLWGHRWDEQLMCVVVYLKEFLGCVGYHRFLINCVD